MIGVLHVVELLSDLVVLLSHFFVERVIARFRLDVLQVDLADVLLDDLLGALDVSFDSLLDESKSTLPDLLTFIIAIGLWLHDEEIVVLILLLLSTLDDDSVITHNGQLCHEAELSLVLEHTSKGVTHNGDQHIEESDLRNEGG